MCTSVDVLTYSYVQMMSASISMNVYTHPNYVITATSGLASLVRPNINIKLLKMQHKIHNLWQWVTLTLMLTLMLRLMLNTKF